MLWLKYIQITMSTKVRTAICQGRRGRGLWSLYSENSNMDSWERDNEKTAFLIGRGKDPFKWNSGGQRNAMEEGLRGRTGITALICSTEQL